MQKENPSGAQATRSVSVSMDANVFWWLVHHGGFLVPSVRLILQLQIGTCCTPCMHCLMETDRAPYTTDLKACVRERHGDAFSRQHAAHPVATVTCTSWHLQCSCCGNFEGTDVTCTCRG